MTTSVIEARTTGNGSSERKPLILLFARYSGREDIHRHLREEDAAIDAEDILTQAEEANALDPVG